MVIEEKIKLSKESREISTGICKFFSQVIKAGKDGGGFHADDIPGIVSSAFSDLLPVLDNTLNVGGEFKEDPAAFLRTAALLGADILITLGVAGSGRDTSK